MKSAIERIMNGKLARQSPEMSKEYWEAVPLTEQKENTLKKHIARNAAAQKAFEEYQEAEDVISIEEAIAYYKEGFRNGFWLAFDVINEEQS